MFEGWQPSPEAWDYANAVMPKGAYEMFDYELDKFVDHWLADAGPCAYKRELCIFPRQKPQGNLIMTPMTIPCRHAIFARCPRIDSAEGSFSSSV